MKNTNTGTQPSRALILAPNKMQPYQPYNCNDRERNRHRGQAHFESLTGRPAFGQSVTITVENVGPTRNASGKEARCTYHVWQPPHHHATLLSVRLTIPDIQ